MNLEVYERKKDFFTKLIDNIKKHFKRKKKEKEEAIVDLTKHDIDYFEKE